MNNKILAPVRPNVFFCAFLRSRVLLLVLFVLTLAGCSSAPKVRTTLATNHDSSRTLDPIVQSNLTQSISKQVARNQQKSGFYFIETGVEAFSALSGLIDKARHSIDVQSFIYHDDQTGRLLAHKLIKAADRGVRVRVLLDDFFSSNKSALLMALDTHPNIEVKFFNPVSTTGWVRPIALIARFSRVTRRMHNKAFIVDNKVAIVGGRNIGDVYYAMRKDYQFTDLDVLSVGPVVGMVSNSFNDFWKSRWVVSATAYSSMDNNPESRTVKRKLRQLKRNAGRLSDSSYMQAIARAGIARKLEQGKLALMWSDARVYYDSPSKVTGRLKYRKLNLMRQMMPHLMQAKSEVLIITPYFVPRWSGLRWIKKLRKKGVRVTVLTNSFASNDIPIAYIGYERYRRKLLKMGVELYEFKPSAYSKLHRSYSWLKSLPKVGLHSKMIIIDSEKLFIGSANINPRSRNLDTEIAILINSHEISDRMSGLVYQMIKPSNSYRVVLQKRKDIWAADEYEYHQDNEDSQNHLVWKTRKNGKKVRLTNEPKTRFLQNFGVIFIGLLPIEGML